MDTAEQQTPTDDTPQHGEFATITVNNQPYTIHRGHETVTAIKEVAGVPTAYQLDELIDGTFTPLKDDGSVTIKGGEQFMSYPKGGQFG